MKKSSISLILNILIVILVTLGTIFMFTGFKFMPSNNSLLSTKIEVFKYFTVDSNVFMGIVSLIYIFKRKNVTKSLSILKLMATSAVTLTFVTTLVFLTPQYGFYQLYNNSNLFFHLLVPILAVVTYIFFENDVLERKESKFGMIPMLLYSVFYTGNILIHLNNDGLTYKYDFYGFIKGNVYNIFISIPIMIVVTYLISLLLVVFNKKASVLYEK